MRMYTIALLHRKNAHSHWGRRLTSWLPPMVELKPGPRLHFDDIIVIILPSAGGFFWEGTQKVLRGYDKGRSRYGELDV